MDFGPVLHPGIIFLVAVILFIVLHGFIRWPLPVAFIAVAVVSAILGGFGIPFRHLVEGGFGFINLALVLFSGAFFGHMMRVSGAADAAAAGIVKWTGGRSWLVLLAVGLPIFVVGMFSGRRAGVRRHCSTSAGRSLDWARAASPTRFRPA